MSSAPAPDGSEYMYAIRAVCIYCVVSCLRLPICLDIYEYVPLLHEKISFITLMLCVNFCVLSTRRPTHIEELYRMPGILCRTF